MAAMRGRSKTAKAVATWVAATSVGISLSWFGVRPVLDAAVPERLVAFPVAEPTTPLPTPASPRSPRSPAPSTRHGTPSRSAAASRPPRATPQPAPPSASATAAPVPAGLQGWTALGDGQYVRRFQLTGGDVTVRAGYDSVELVSATPRPLYVMTVLPATSNHFTVSFTTILRSSKLDVSWQDSAPVAKTTELP
jgi:hypothetical protein